jgi:hypothetical protein
VEKTPLRCFEKMIAVVKHLENAAKQGANTLPIQISLANSAVAFLEGLKKPLEPYAPVHYDPKNPGADLIGAMNGAIAKARELIGQFRPTVALTGLIRFVTTIMPTHTCGCLITWRGPFPIWKIQGTVAAVTAAAPGTQPGDPIRATMDSQNVGGESTLDGNAEVGLWASATDVDILITGCFVCGHSNHVFDVSSVVSYRWKKNSGQGFLKYADGGNAACVYVPPDLDVQPEGIWKDKAELELTVSSPGEGNLTAIVTIVTERRELGVFYRSTSVRLIPAGDVSQSPLQQGCGCNATHQWNSRPALSDVVLPGSPDHLCVDKMTVLSFGGSDADLLTLYDSYGQRCGGHTPLEMSWADFMAKYEWSINPPDAGDFPLGTQGRSIVYIPRKTGKVTFRCKMTDSGIQAADPALQGVANKIGCKDGLSIPGLKEGDEKTVGAMICLNNDYDEKNRNGVGILVPDNQDDAVTGGPRIIAGDDDIVSAKLSMSAENGEAGKWQLVFSKRFKIWQKDPRNAGFIEVISGRDYGEVKLPLEGLPLWIEGVGPSQKFRDTEIKLVFTFKNNDVCEKVIKCTILRVALKEVWFTDFVGASGVQLRDHYKDMNGNNTREQGEEPLDNDIDAPGWVADDHRAAKRPDWLEDGPDTDRDPERNKHALFPRNTKFEVKAVFSIDGPELVAGYVKAQATCLDGRLNLASKALQKVGSNWEGTFEIATAPDKTGVLKDFQWSWNVLLKDGITWDKEKSTHTVFVCYEAPPEVPYDRVVSWACEWGKDYPAQNEPDADTRKKIVDAIWAKIATRSATGYKYWGPQTNENNPVTTQFLLVNEHGKCGSWARFFRDLNGVHNIDVPDRRIIPDQAQGVRGFQVKNILLGPIRFPSPPAGHPNCKYARVEIDGSPEGIPGQGMSTPIEKAFTDHRVNVYAGAIYDPSYGEKYEGTDPLKTWEEAAIDSFTCTERGTYRLPDGTLVETLLAEPNDSTTKKTKWE